MSSAKNKGINPRAVVVLPDTHFPYQDQVAVDVALKAISLIKPSRVVHLGDLLDCEAFSSHGRKKLSEGEAMDFIAQEITPARAMIDRAMKSTDQWIQLEGNHEYRAERWALSNGFSGAAAFNGISPSRLLSEGRSNKEFKWIPYIEQNKQVSGYKITRDLMAVHGWSFAKHAASVHAERGRGMSVVFGHCHRMQYYATRDHFHNRVVRAFTPGCLAKLQPLYTMGNQPPTEWVHGFAIIYVGKRSWSEYMVKIEKGGCVLPDGREVRV